MQNIIRPVFPALLFLLLGMIFFPALSAISIPPFLNHKIIFGLVACAVLFFMSYRFVKYEDSSLSEFNLWPTKQSGIKLGYGLLIGGLITGLMLIIMFTLTDLNLAAIDDQSWFLFFMASLVFIPLALMEEILFRGYPFFRLSKVLNVRWVVLLTSTLFALYHYNGTQSLVTLLLGPGIWGVVFAVAAYLSKSIAVPLGIHIAANFMQALLGLKADYSAMWSTTIVENSSNFGVNIEALGIALQIVLLIMTILVFEFSIRREKSKTQE
jgi:CAAX protease family protein